MLVINDAISGKKVMSIHAGGAIASIEGALIDPSNLKILAFSVNAKNIKYFSVVFSSDIREWGQIGAIINSEDEIIEVDENLPKIKDIAQSKFRLEGIGVRTESGRRLGRVKNYIFETDGFFVVKFYIEKIAWLGIFKQPIVIERESIINVTDKFLVVSDDASKVKNTKYGFMPQSSEAAKDMASDQDGKI